MPISAGLRTSILVTSGLLNISAGTHFFLLSPILRYYSSISNKSANAVANEISKDEKPLTQNEVKSSPSAPRKRHYHRHYVLHQIVQAGKTRGWLMAAVGILELGVAYITYRYPHHRIPVTTDGRHVGYNVGGGGVGGGHGGGVVGAAASSSLFELATYVSKGSCFIAGKIGKLVLFTDLYMIGSATLTHWRWSRKQKKLLRKSAGSDAVVVTEEVNPKPATALVVVWAASEAVAMTALMISGSLYRALMY